MAQAKSPNPCRLRGTDYLVVVSVFAGLGWLSGIWVYEQGFGGWCAWLALVLVLPVVTGLFLGRYAFAAALVGNVAVDASVFRAAWKWQTEHGIDASANALRDLPILVFLTILSLVAAWLSTSIRWKVRRVYGEKRKAQKNPVTIEAERQGHR